MTRRLCKLSSARWILTPSARTIDGLTMCQSVLLGSRSSSINVLRAFVIARNTAFTYKGKAVDARQIGRDLGVRYVLEGSIRRSGDEVRVNTQLVDAETGAHLWAERFDRQTGDLFKLQNEITGQIASTLGTQLVISEAGRRGRSCRRVTAACAVRPAR